MLRKLNMGPVRLALWPRMRRCFWKDFRKLQSMAQSHCACHCPCFLSHLVSSRCLQVQWQTWKPWSPKHRSVMRQLTSRLAFCAFCFRVARRGFMFLATCQPTSCPLCGMLRSTVREDGVWKRFSEVQTTLGLSYWLGRECFR